jgi:ankyrin repeat protein
MNISNRKDVIDKLKYSSSYASPPSYSNQNLQSPLSQAILIGDDFIVDLLLKSGQSHPEYEIVDGINAFHYAIVLNRMELLQKMLEYHPNVCVFNKIKDVKEIQKIFNLFKDENEVSERIRKTLLYYRFMTFL